MPKAPTRRLKQFQDTKKPQKTLDGGDKAYESFLKRLEVISLGMKSCSANVDRETLFSLFASRKKGLAQTFDSSFKVSDIGTDYFDCEGQFSVIVKNGPSSDVISVQCTFEVHMHGESPIQREQADRFASSELRLILAPYARYCISNMTAQMSIPPIVIPLTTKAY